MVSYGLTEEIIQKIISVFSKHPQIEKAILYGSRAKGTYKNGSDIDITFMGEDIDLTVVNQIVTELDDLLLQYSFDLSSYKHLSNKDFIEHIDSVGKVFYQKVDI